MTSAPATDAARTAAVDVCGGAGCTTGQPARPTREDQPTPRPGPPGRPGRPPAPGLRLCPDCAARLAGDLRRLPGLYEACGRLLDGGSQDRTRPRTTGGPLRGLPFNAHAAEVRGEILAVLGSWAGAVVGERGVPAPRRAVLPLCVFLTGHLPWLLAHDAAAEFSAEVARLVRRARRVVDPDVRRRVRLGACVERGCGGSLTAVLPPGAAGAAAVIRCDRDPAHHWQGHEWLRLGRRPDGPGPGAAEAPAARTVRWLTAADIARLWGISTGSAYRHASQSEWRRLRRGGRTYYHGDDVARTLSPR
ncbi:helix-turn-helix domain-containing protein [Streptomyces sp. NPDC049590]|uniref:helix-turn-helix domain-containing protein n=1 Tax=Streptomyces sp. NPDC049590 TaxID=3154834 RepID=UPI003413899B